jgi:hypothetical protein
MTDSAWRATSIEVRMLNRRDWLKLTISAAAGAIVTRPGLLQALAAPAMTVYKTPTCGCCGEWVKHVEAAGIKVTSHNLNDLGQIRSTLGVPPTLASCHTGVIEGYAVEGHVPADLILRMIREKPTGTLLAVPGMPVGSPGMEVGARKDPYDVILYDRKTGRSSVYAKR